MEKELNEKEKEKKYWEKYWMKRGRGGCPVGGGGSGAIYGLGFIGALIFFVGHATTFWYGVLGFFQAIVWPAFVVYELLKFLIK
ncbi:MAG: hypothetical protein PHO93_01075 [Candidatus Saccharimonadaceae bacterium]|nr:hypothetical protein [Candidatus Saccharimonadaceae bacterium]